MYLLSFYNHILVFSKLLFSHNFSNFCYFTIRLFSPFKGIGAAIAKTIGIESKVSVVVNYFSSPDKAEEVVKAIKEGGGVAIAVKADVTKESDVANLYDSAIK